jgi:hypothetical protein
MKYLILINATTEGREMFKTMTDAERIEATAGYRRLNEDLAASGERIAAAALTDPDDGKKVTVTNGQTMITDGPFAEVKEFLAGFYLIECDTIERAAEHAAKLPEAAWGLVEVRPVLDLSHIGLV